MMFTSIESIVVVKLNYAFPSFKLSWPRLFAWATLETADLGKVQLPRCSRPVAMVR